MVCKELFQALEACHADKWRKWTGGCNSDKHELNMCLRKVVRLPLNLRCVTRLKLSVFGGCSGWRLRHGTVNGRRNEGRKLRVLGRSCTAMTRRFAPPRPACTRSHHLARRRRRSSQPALAIPLASPHRAAISLIAAIRRSYICLLRLSAHCTVDRVFLTIDTRQTFTWCSPHRYCDPQRVCPNATISRRVNLGHK